MHLDSAGTGRDLQRQFAGHLQRSFKRALGRLSKADGRTTQHQGRAENGRAQLHHANLLWRYTCFVEKGSKVRLIQ